MTARSEIFKTTLVVICLILNSNLFSQNYWQQTNGPYGGRASAFCYNQITQNFFCFCSEQIFKCIPDSNSWQKINVPFYPVKGFGISPGGLFFCSTFEDKLYRSSDEGLNWEHIGFEIPYYLTESIFAFTQNGTVFFGEMGIYRSTNNGYNWECVCNSITVVKSMAVNYNGDIYAGSLWEGLYKSTNDGTDWNLIAFQDSSIYGLTVNSKGYVFAASDGKIRRSTNNGESWELMISGLVSQTFSLFTDRYDNVYAGPEDQGILESTDDGVTWVFKNRGLYNKDVISFGEYNENIYCGTDYGKGINKFDRISGRWIVNNKNVCGSNVNSLAVHPSGRLFSHVNKDGVYYSDDEGINWIRTNLNDTLYIDSRSSLAINSTGDIYAICNAALYKSSDYGESWFRIYSSPNIVYGDLFASPNGTLFISNSSGLYSSSNSGLNWVRINGFSYLDAFNINSEGTLFAAGNSQICISTDNGSNWIPRGMNGQWVLAISFDRYNNVYAGTCDHGLFKSTNNGLNWQNIGLGGRDVDIISINKNDEIIVCTEYGLYASTSNGLSWISFQNGIFDGLKTIAVDSSGYFFAGTYEEGVYKTFSSLISVKPDFNNIPEKFNLIQNFPNPFNPVTTIKFEIPVLSKVKIIIYDMLGREVQELLNQKLNPGTYEVKWNADKFSSGVYFYSLQTDEFTQTKKMVLIK